MSDYLTFEQRFSAARARLQAARLRFHSARTELALAMKEVETVLRRPQCTFGNSPEVEVENGVPHFYSEDSSNELS